MLDLDNNKNIRRLDANELTKLRKLVDNTLPIPIVQNFLTDQYYGIGFEPCEIEEDDFLDRWN